MTPLLKPAMDGCVIRITSWRQVPLHTDIRYLEHRCQDGPRRNRFALWAIVRNVFFRKMPPNPVPLVVGQAKHDGGYTYGAFMPSSILR